MIKKFEEFKNTEIETVDECLTIDNSIREIMYQRIKTVVMDSLMDYDEKIDTELNQFIDKIYKAPVEVTNKQDLFDRYNRELETDIYNRDDGKILQYIINDLFDNIGTTKTVATDLANEFISTIGSGVDVIRTETRIEIIRTELYDKYMDTEQDTGVMDIDVLQDELGDFINIVVKNDTEVSVPESYKGFRLKIERSDEESKIEEYKKLNETVYDDFIKEINEND